MNQKRKACARPGCPTIHEGPGLFCDKHKRKRMNPPSSAASRGYDYEWQKARTAYLLRHPWCVCAECRASGKPFPSDTVDHIIPHRGDDKLFWDMSNWQALAQLCHNRKTVEKDGGLGR